MFMNSRMIALVEQMRAGGRKWRPTQLGWMTRRRRRKNWRTVDTAIHSESLENRLLLTGWSQQGLDIDGEAPRDLSGRSVSINADGSMVAIGAPRNSDNGLESGTTRVYRINAGAWTQVGLDIDGEGEFDASGESVSLSADGKTLAIGAPFSSGNGTYSGHVRVYRLDDSDIWRQIGEDIDGENSNDRSGYSVSLSADGTTVAIGASRNSGGNFRNGHVRVYSFEDESWTQVGLDIDGEASMDQSGGAVSLSADGTTLAVGSIGSDDNGDDSGKVRVYRFLDDSWTQAGLDIDGEAEDDFFGFSVSMSADGSTVAIGAVHNDGGGNNSGHVRVFRIQEGVWTQVGEDIDGQAADNNAGRSVSLSADGSTVAVGAPNTPGEGQYAGQTRVFRLDDGAWAQVGENIAGEGGTDSSGWSVSLSADGNRLAIGATTNDDGGTNAGHVRVYELVPTVDLSVSANSGGEADTTTITVTVTADEPVRGDQTTDINFAGADITVDDYLLSSTIVTIPDGMTTGTVTFMVQDDRRLEAPETGTLVISNPSSGLLIGASTQHITISDDEIATDNITLSGENDNAVLVNNNDGTFTLRDDNGTFGGDLIFNPDPNGVTVNGLGGDDIIDFSIANFPATLNGGCGNDFTTGGNHGNHLNGQSGDDTMIGGVQNDAIYGGAGHDMLNGGAGNDIMRGNSGNDVLFGGAGRDILDGGDGNDLLRGQGGSGDQLTGADGDDTLDGGSGSDQVMERGDVDFTLADTELENSNLSASTATLAGLGMDLLIAVEEVVLAGGMSGNRIDASAFSHSTLLNGRGGNDTLLGGLGDDILRGGAGSDWLSGGDGNDILFGQGGSMDVLNGGVGIDILVGGAGRDRITDDAADSILFDPIDIILEATS